MREAQAKRREDEREQAIRNKAAQAQLQKQVIEFLALSSLWSSFSSPASPSSDLADRSHVHIEDNGRQESKQVL